MQVAPFTPDDSERWDRLVESAPMATFLHSRRFLAYHGDRFEDASVVLSDGLGALRAVLPAALDPDDHQRVVSHPGATYGGLVHGGRLTGERVRDALALVAAHYADRGLRVLRYRAVPHIYHRSPSADDVWALGELGAERVRADLSCTIDLAARRTPSTLRSRSLAKALRAGVEVSEHAELRDFWPVLESNLERRHSARPVHTLEEIERLRSAFPETILPFVALADGRVVAGVVLFRTETVMHVQYLAATEEGMRTNAQDVVIERAISLAAEMGVRWFDFGISPGQGRRGLNQGIYAFKAGFGGGGVVHEHYEMPLDGERA